MQEYQYGVVQQPCPGWERLECWLHVGRNDQNHGHTTSVMKRAHIIYTCTFYQNQKYYALTIGRATTQLGSLSSILVDIGSGECWPIILHVTPKIETDWTVKQLDVVEPMVSFYLSIVLLKPRCKHWSTIKILLTTWLHMKNNDGG